VNGRVVPYLHGLVSPALSTLAGSPPPRSRWISRGAWSSASKPWARTWNPRGTRLHAPQPALIPPPWVC